MCSSLPQLSWVFGSAGQKPRMFWFIISRATMLEINRPALISITGDFHEKADTTVLQIREHYNVRSFSVYVWECFKFIVTIWY